MPEPIELRFSSELAAPPDVVWERAGTVRGANDELWPLARMTFPFPLDRRTPPEQVVGHDFRSWMLALGFLPVDRRTLRVEVFEEGRFRERSDSWMQGRWSPPPPPQSLRHANEQRLTGPVGGRQTQRGSPSTSTQRPPCAWTAK